MEKNSRWETRQDFLAELMNWHRRFVLLRERASMMVSLVEDGDTSLRAKKKALDDLVPNENTPDMAVAGEATNRAFKLFDQLKQEEIDLMIDAVRAEAMGMIDQAVGAEVVPDEEAARLKEVFGSQDFNFEGPTQTQKSIDLESVDAVIATIDEVIASIQKAIAAIDTVLALNAPVVDEQHPASVAEAPGVSEPKSSQKEEDEEAKSVFQMVEAMTSRSAFTDPSASQHEDDPYGMPEHSAPSRQM